MSGKRTKQLRSEALKLGIDIFTIQIKGKGTPNQFRKIKKQYIRLNES